MTRMSSSWAACRLARRLGATRVTASAVLVAIGAAPVQAQCPIEWVQASAGVPAVPSDPPIRQNHAAAYDAARQRVVVFGGFLGGFGRYGDTWTWDGAAWSLAHSGGPSARANHAMAYDAARQRVVLFGGSDGTPLGDTWEWDGVSWTQAAPAASPAGRFNHAMAYDSDRHVVVLTGGFSTVRHNDTWEYDGVTWTQRTEPGFTNYLGRNGHGMAYDASRQTMVIFGGFGGSPSARLADTWELGPTGWTLSPLVGPSGRQYLGGLAYNPEQQLVYLFGGQTGPLSQDRVNDVWTFDGAAWTQAFAGTPAPNPVPATEPNRRDQHTTTYDEARRELVVFGGYQGATFGGVAGDTWTTGCPAVCYPDCDENGTLNVNDYICFQTKFALGDPYADCDGNGARNVNDYICFQTKFAIGC